jgi:uncharacterized protein
VVIPDTNVLVHAGSRQAREHRQAFEWLLAALRGHEPVGFAWTVVIAFIRLITNPRVFPTTLDVRRAMGLAELWLSAAPAVIIEPIPGHLPRLSGLLAQSGTAGNLVNDADLAALALEHDATIVSFDRDFQRFEGVRSRVPA